VAKSKSSPIATREDHPVVKYVKSTRAELRRVTWPTREETRTLTTIIVIVTVVMGLFLGILDFLFQQVAAGVIGGNFIIIAAAVLLLGAGAAAFYFNGQE
jgi:preprotein translocase subunit SecE